MIKRTLIQSAIALMLSTGSLAAHCQMPCGIYHDDMVFNQIDQYVETMVKGVTVLTDNKFNTVAARNEFVRWDLLKERLSDETAELILTYFLQQKVKPGEEDTAKRLVSAHSMLFTLVLIKQTVDMEAVKKFSDEWEKFKLMFHVENYECKMELKELKDWEEKQKAHEEAHKNGVEHKH